MKNLLLIVLILFSNISFSQYLPMLEEDHIWSVDEHSSDFGEDPYIITNQISVSGSTVINGKTYKSVINSNIPEIDCLVREENGIVYRYDESTEEEFIMYDFSLEIGDFFIFFQSDWYCSIYGFEPDSNVSAEVINTSISFIAGEDRKLIEFENFFGEVEIWIEGIGSNRGFDPVGVIWDIVDRSDLVCFTNSSETYFFNGATSCDNTTLGVEDEFESKILLYPNPVKNQSILNLPIETSIDKIIIIDFLGRLIKQEKISKDYTIINNMDYPSGIYFYQVFSENKLIKTDSFIID